jgi:ABC-type branched-subunit amino acid transport system ATPase component/ABC-type branched-subunit amino acid transport system permease subunit
VRSRPAAQVTALVVAVIVLTVVFPHKVPMGTVLYGVLYGSLKGLLAVGLVLIYRVSRSINFAYGAMGGLPGGIAASLYLSHHIPWALAITISAVLGIAVGAAVGALINWRFAHSPRLVLTVASIGLAQLLGGIALYVPRYFHGPGLITSFRTGLSSWHGEINPVLFNGNDLVVVVAVPIVVAGTAWFLLRTDAGRAVRAIADNDERARLVGIPTRRLMLGVWGISGLVAGLAVILQAPSAGVPLDAAAGPAILLPPLAAAVIARMDSLSLAFGAGIGLGVLESVVRLDISKQSIETPVFLVVILVALLLQRRSHSRAEAADESSWSAAGALQPIPARLARLPEVRVLRGVLWAALAVLALLLPVSVGPARLYQVTVGLVFGVTALSLVMLSGWSGTVSLGQLALVGVGSIMAGDMMLHFNLDFFLSLVAACGAGAVAALILGLPALRVKGLYLAVTTLAFAVAANDFFFNPTNFGKQLPASIVKPVLLKRFDLNGGADLYFLALAILVVAVALTRQLRVGRPGRAILASRDNARAAEACAIGTTRTRLMTFAVSGMLAGAAGAVYVVTLGGVGYQTFQPTDSITVFSMVVIGGISSISGSLAGVALIQWIGIEFPQAQLLLTRVGLLIVLMVFPSGLAGLYQRLRDRALAAVARRRGIATGAWAEDQDSSADEAEAETTEVPAIAAATAASDAILSCRGVNASFGSMQVLFGVDLDVQEGEILALLGTNGAGKSTLLKTVMGLLPSRSGGVTLAGTDVSSASTERMVASGVGMMPGGRGVFPSLTVEENLRVASWPLRRDRGAADAARAEALTRFPVLEQRRNIAAGNLSGGEQQMLSLAMAFLVRPRILCIDELSLGLAPTVVGTLVDAVKEIHDSGVTIVIVEQSVNVALLLASRATFLEKGQVRFSGPSQDLVDRPDLLRAVFIGGSDDVVAPSVPAARTNGSAARTNGSAARTNGTEAEPVSSQPALRCADLVKRFGGVTAVDHVDLSVAPGEVVGLIGHNGAGKTTLFDLISGFLPPDGGLIVLEGEEITGFPAWERSVAGLGRSFQEARLFPSLTVTETIAVACDRHLENRDPFAAAFKMPAATDSEARLAVRVDQLIEEFGLAAYRTRPVGQLSTGTRRIVELACIMAHRPAVMLLDEPSGGVAQSETEALGAMLRQVAANTGCSMVVIEHDMNMLSSLCDRLVALELGRVIADGSPAEVLSHPEVVASYLGTDASVISRSGRRTAKPRGAARKRPPTKTPV